MTAPQTSPDHALEALAKAKLDLDSVVEADRRATAAGEAEKVAPLLERKGPLPDRLQTLRYLAPEDQQLYARDMDGTFALAWVRASDNESLLAHSERIGKTLHVLGDDETPASRKAQQMKQEQQLAKVNEILRRDAEAKIEADRQALEARQRQEREAFERERARYIESFRAPHHRDIE